MHVTVNDEICPVRKARSVHEKAYAIFFVYVAVSNTSSAGKVHLSWSENAVLNI